MKQLEKTVPVAILGATGAVGQKFIELLENHPWFDIVALAASERSTEKKYGEVVNWQMQTPLSEKIADMTIQPCIPEFPCKIVFSGLDSKVAGVIEEDFANAGYMVISNSKNHRMHPNVPMLIPEVNIEHMALLKKQSYLKGGKIVTNPNCSVIGLAVALAPLEKRFGIETVDVVTMQALSGAGYPGVPSFDLIDNVIPYIDGEEEKMESEPLKIFGKLTVDEMIPHTMNINAQCNRVSTLDGHLECVTIKLEEDVTAEEIIQAWKEFNPLANLHLPSAPSQPLHYLENLTHPQPRKHRHLGGGMTVSLGRLRKASRGRWKFVLLSHNTIRGAAGTAILNAECLMQCAGLNET